MKKRFLSIILALAVVAGLVLPVSAASASGTQPVCVDATSGTALVTDIRMPDFDASEEYQLVKLNDTDYLLLFIAEVPSRSAKNQKALYYSVFSDSAWSTPVILNDDGTADDHPYAADIGNGKIFVSWSSANRVHSEDVSNSDFLNSFEIQATFFDKASKAFESVAQVTKTTELDTAEDIALSAVYNNTTRKIQLYFEKNVYEDHNGQHFYAYLFYDCTQSKWLNTGDEYRDEELPPQDPDTLKDEHEEYRENFYGQRFFASPIRKGYESLAEMHFMEKDGNVVVTHLNSSDDRRSEVNKIDSIGFGQWSFDVNPILSGRFYGGLPLGDKTATQPKVLLNEANGNGLIFVGTSNLDGTDGEIKCFSFYSEDNQFIDDNPWEKYIVITDVRSFKTSDIENYSVCVEGGEEGFDETKNVYLMYSDTNMIKAAILGYSASGNDVAVRGGDFELVIAENTAANSSFKLLAAALENGKINLRCILNGTNINEFTHTPYADPQVLGIKLEKENPLPNEAVNAVVTLCNCGFAESTAPITVDVSATGNTLSPITVTDKLIGGETVTLKFQITVPAGTRNVTVSAKTDEEDKKELKLTYIYDFTEGTEFTAPIAKSDLFYSAQPQELVAPLEWAADKRQALEENYEVLYQMVEQDESGAFPKPAANAWSQEIPTATDAAVYGVYFSIKAKDGTEYIYNEYTPAAPIEVTIAPKNIKNAAIALGESLTYNGKEQTQAVAEVEVDGILLTEGKDYIVSGNKKTDVGDYELTITGNGNFTGTAKASFSITVFTPEIIDGKGQSLTAGEKKELTFRSNAAYSDFIRVEVDGETVDGKNYTVKEGSTIVTLKADYVATLSVGEHTLGIVSESGTATTTFTVNAKVVDTNSPQTGDNSHMALWLALLFVSGGLLTVTGVYGKKKKYSVK